MANIALFVSETFVKKNSNIDGNVDVKYITPVIEKVQKLYIRPALGTALYDEIAAEILAGSVSADNTTLLEDYIQDAMVNYVVAKGMTSFAYKIENKSVATKNSENATPVDDSIIQKLVAEAFDDAEYFRQQLMNFLQANADADTYNAYLNPGTAFDTIRPTKNSYTVGWALDEPTKIPKNIDVSPSKYDCL